MINNTLNGLLGVNYSSGTYKAPTFAKPVPQKSTVLPPYQYQTAPAPKPLVTAPKAPVPAITATPTTQNYTSSPITQTSTTPTAPASTGGPKGVLTYPGIVGNISNSAQGLGAQAERINTTASNIGQYGQMTPEEQAARQQLANSVDQQGRSIGSVESHPADINYGLGLEGVINRTAAAQQAGLGQAISGYAAERQANLGAAQGQANAEQGAGNLLSSQGGLYGSAAGYAQPQLGSYGQTYYSPLEANHGGGNLDPQTQATSLAQKVINGQMTYDQALQSLGYAGNVGSTFLNNAITGAGGNPLQLQAQGSTQQNIIGTQGTQIAQYQSALQQGQNLQAQVTDLITSFGLNPNDLNAVNSGLQKIAQNTSSPQYKILQNYVNDIANTYSQVLTPPGGSSTDTTRGIATSMLDATASGQSLIQVMKSLDEAAKAKIAGVSTTGNSGSGGGGTGGGKVQTSAGLVDPNF